MHMEFSRSFQASPLNSSTFQACVNTVDKPHTVKNNLVVQTSYVLKIPKSCSMQRGTLNFETDNNYLGPGLDRMVGDLIA